MTPEEFNRIKEAEKAHLRKLKALKQAAGRLERQKSIAQALGSMTQEAQQKLEANQNTVEQLAWETAQQEARLEIALETAREAEGASARNEHTPEQDLAQAEEAMRRARAEELVRQIKEGIGMDAPTSDASTSDGRPSPEPGRTAQDVRPDRDTRDPGETLPDKTIGRMPQP